MLTCADLHAVFDANGVKYFTGVPDSTFAPWMSYLANHEDVLVHRIAANEGAAIAHAAGYHLATGELGLAYLQNAGLGNCVNPLTSLVDPEVYGLPMLLMIGWRGEPGRSDEPQHRKMGRVTVPVLDALGIAHRELTGHRVDETVRGGCELARRSHAAVAFIIRRGLFSAYSVGPKGPPALHARERRSEKSGLLSREEAVGIVVTRADAQAVVISTTGGISRELFEHREKHGRTHATDFYTVGAMGHSAAIGLEVALQRPDRTVYVLDGDGALLMHLGTIATIGYYAPRNLVHVVFDNNCYESTGGQPTVSNVVDIAGLARDCGYATVRVCSSRDEVQEAIGARSVGPGMIVVKVGRGSRSDLGRPTLSPIHMKQAFVNRLLAS